MSPADGCSPCHPSSIWLQDAAGIGGLFEGTFGGADKSSDWTGTARLCNGERAYVRLCCPKSSFCSLFLRSLVFSTPAPRLAELLAELSSQLLFGLDCTSFFFFCLFSGEIMLGPFCFGSISRFCAELWLARQAWQNPPCAARILWLDMFTIELFSISNTSALNIVPPQIVLFQQEASCLCADGVIKCDMAHRLFTFSSQRMSPERQTYGADLTSDLSWYEMRFLFVTLPLCFFFRCGYF